MQLKFKRTLLICPHPDDEIACAGLLQKINHSDNHIHPIYICIEPSARQGIPYGQMEIEVHNSLKILGINPDHVNFWHWPGMYFETNIQFIRDEIYQLGNTFKPDLVICPATNDRHQDHRVVNQVVKDIFLETTDTIILGYFALPSPISKTDMILPITQDMIDIIIESSQCYSSQSYRHYFSKERIVARYREIGGLFSYKYAEAYEVIKICL